MLPLPFFVALRDLRGQKEVAVAVLPLPFSAALRDLRGQRCYRCRSSWPLVSFVDQKRCSSRSFVALRGQKEVAVAVAVAVLRGPPCPPRTKVLPLPFSAALRDLRGQRCCRCRSSWPFVTFVDKKKLPLQFCSCRSPRPSVSSVDKGVAVAVLRALRGSKKVCSSQPFKEGWHRKSVTQSPAHYALPPHCPILNPPTHTPPAPAETHPISCTV